LLTIVFCHVSCAIAHIISPIFSSLRHEFLNSRTALTLTHCIRIEAVTSETSITGEMLGTPTQCHTFVLYVEAG